MTTGTATKAAAKPKYARLAKAEIDQIAEAFKAPLLRAAAEKRDAARIGSGRAVYDAAFPADVQSAIKTLAEHCLTKGVSSLYVDTGNGYRTRLELGATYQIVEHYSCAPTVSREIAGAAEEIELQFSVEVTNIQKMASSVKSAALAFRTRHDFGQAWAPLYDLMGQAWVDAQVSAPNTLPAVIDLDAATAAICTLMAA